MRKKIFFLLILVIAVSCTKQKQQDTKVNLGNETKIATLSLDTNSNENIKDWFNYYISNDSTFDLNNFKYENTDTLEFMQGNVLGIFDDKFDSIYNAFLVFNKNKTKYIDFDSYQWQYDKQYGWSAKADQEIDLVDVENKTVTRIAFFGPSQYVEDVFWKNDYTVVLLENNAEDIPSVSIINLNKQTAETFTYKSKLGFETDYTKYRFKKKGLKE